MYGNSENLGSTKNGNPLVFEETDFTIGFTSQCFLFNVQLVLWLQEMGDLYEKSHFAKETIEFWVFGSQDLCGIS